MHECALRQIKFFFFFLSCFKQPVPSVCGWRHAGYLWYLCIFNAFSFLVTLTSHIVSHDKHTNNPPVQVKTLSLCVKCKVKRVKPVVTITLNSLPTIPWWLLSDRLPWLPDIEGTSPSICAAAIASIALALTFPLFLSITSSTAIQNAIHSENREEGWAGFFEKLQHQQNWTQPTKAGEWQWQATGTIKNSWPIERH